MTETIATNPQKVGRGVLTAPHALCNRDRESGARHPSALRTASLYRRTAHLYLIFALLLGLAIAATAASAPLCRIEVVEKGSGWPVPLVELRTTHHARFITDNAGVIAFDLPEGMGREVWFDVIGHGYEVPKDVFGMRGVRLKPEPGRTLKVEVSRTIV